MQCSMQAITRGLCGYVQRALGTARVWNVAVKEQRVYGGRLKFTLKCTFLAKAESSNVDMWVGMRSAWHSKSLERRCQTVVRMFPGCCYTRCALIRTDGILV